MTNWYPQFTASNAKFVMPTFTDTPTPTIVDAEVAENRIELGAGHRAEAVVPGQDEVAGVDADLGGRSHSSRPRGEVDGRLLRAHEQPGVPVGALTVGACLGRAVHNGDAGRARGASQLGAVLHDAGLLRLGRQHRQGRRLSDHTVLNLLQHECGVSGRDQLVQVEWHGDR
jgi:hypothetical protein